MEKLKPILPFILILSIAVVLIIILFPTAHPYGGVSLPLDRAAILERAHEVLTALQLNDAEIWPSVTLQSDRSLLRQAQQTKGIAESNALLRDSLSVYRWKVRWQRNNDLKFSFGNNDRDEKQRMEKIENLIRGDITFYFDTHGKLVEFARAVSDTLQLPTLTSSEAKRLAAEFLRPFISPIYHVDTENVISEQVTQQLHRVDYEFTWLSPVQVLGDPVKIKVRVAGNIIAAYEPHIAIPDEYTHRGSDSAAGMIFILVCLAGGILLVVVGIKRIRSYEIGFRQALMMGGIVAVAFAIQLYINMMDNRNIWDILIPVVLIPIFVGGILVLLWAVSESLAREVWREKMIPFDMMFKGYVAQRQVGLSVVRGMALGTALFAVLLLLIRAGDSILPISNSLGEDSSLHTFDSTAPWLVILSLALYASCFVFAFALLFWVSYLRKHLSSTVLVFVLSTVVLAVISLERMEPLPVALGIFLINAFITVWIFYRFDGLTSLLTIMMYIILPEAAGLFCAGNASMTDSGMIIVIAGAIVFAGSLIVSLRKDQMPDYDAIAPAFAKHITERQRLQQELEIARNVQMSFLPKCDPDIPQFDICSRCAPAQEVGGDYYDFIEMKDGKFAVAIGDVSGKGTQAAFFMTLTKGFLRALAHVSASPAKVLTLVNHLFYENVERGMFISMIYGVFDLKKRKLTIARAGHNPVIIRKSKTAAVQVVNPAGLALGLDPGPKFEDSIEEISVDYRAGDVFIFYTDGFTEAMNKDHEEYGEKRLTETVEKFSHLPAAKIITGIFEEMKSFVGKTQQHDDMTIVVVKVKGAK